MLTTKKSGIGVIKASYTKKVLLVIGIILTTLGLTSPVLADNNLSNSYQSNSPIPAGQLVSLASGKNGNLVEPANIGNANKLLGVAVQANQSLLAVNAGRSRVQVAISGTALVAVSNLNGAISAGDAIAVSPVNGVGMKASPGLEMIGVAKTAFNTTASTIKISKIHNSKGQIKEVKIGFVSVAIKTGIVPGSDQGGLNKYEKLVSYLAGHDVSASQATVAGAIVLVTVIAMAVLVGGAVRGSLISVGRNPLAKGSILTAAAQILAMTALLALLAVIALFLVLR